MNLPKDKLRGISVLVLSHGLSVAVGIYDGCNNKNNSLFYPLLINMAGTALAYTVLEKKGKVLDEILAGALMGGIVSPIEYYIGKGIGNISSYIF